MTQAEFSEMVGKAMEQMDDQQRGEFIAELDRRMPGNPEIELAFMYHANPEFKSDLQDYVWERTH